MNVTPIIAVNQCGILIDTKETGNNVNKSNKGFVGGSVILDAKGARRSVNHVDDVNNIDYKYHDNKERDDENTEGYILGEIDKNFTRISREANPEYINRRIDLYKEWL